MARDLIKIRKTMGLPLLHDVDDPLWTARPVILDDLSRPRQTCGFIRLERGHDILRLGQEWRHAARIKDCLTRTVGANQTHGMRRIPQQRHAAEGPVREGLTIAHGVFVEFRRGTDDLDWIDGGKLEYSLDVRQEFIKPTKAVPILAPGWWRVAIAELGGHSPVQERGSGSARLVRDGIEYQLGLHPAGNDHRARRQKRWMLNGATPEH